MLELLKVSALVLTLADGAVTCGNLRDGGMERNQFMLSKTCKGVMLQKSLLAAPMWIIPNKKIQLIFAAGNLAGGGFGFVVSLRGRNGR